MMMFQSKFVFEIIRGKSVSWNAQNRKDDGTDLLTAWRIHKNQFYLGGITWWLVYKYANSLFWWISPIAIGLILSIPISVLTSKSKIGLWLKRNNYFLIKEEKQIPNIITQFHYWNDELKKQIIEN